MKTYSVFGKSGPPLINAHPLVNVQVNLSNEKCFSTATTQFQSTISIILES